MTVWTKKRSEEVAVGGMENSINRIETSRIVFHFRGGNFSVENDYVMGRVGNIFGLCVEEIFCTLRRKTVP